MFKIDKYLNFYFFLVLNIIIILLTELTGGGQLFFKNGIIHIIAIFFVMLAGLRVFFHRYTHDPILEKFIHASLAAMVVFAISHLVEFFSFKILHDYNDAVYSNVANFYLVSLLLIAIGSESFLRVLHSRSRLLVHVLITFVFGLFVFSIFLMSNNNLISLEPSSLAPFVYLVLVLVFTMIGLTKMKQIKNHVYFTHGFVNYISAAIVLIGIAVMPNIFYDFLIDLFKFPEYQVSYLSHFAFYIALSLFYLAFGQVKNLGGMLEEIKK